MKRKHGNTSNERPDDKEYKCEICSKTFVNKGNLKFHKRKRHGQTSDDQAVTSLELMDKNLTLHNICLYLIRCKIYSGGILV